jgi:heptosyltransferase-2
MTSYFMCGLEVPKNAHMVEVFRQPCNEIGLNLASEWKAPENTAEAYALPLKDPGVRRIGIHAGATHPTQRWPVVHFGDLARRLVGAGHQVVILGASWEKQWVEGIVDASGDAAVGVYADDLMRFGRTLQELDLLVCNNSGPLHLASLLDVPTLSFMGPALKQRWWPRHDRARVLRLDSLPCIGCNTGYCRIRSHACMEEILPEHAFEEAISMMSELEPR